MAESKDEKIKNKKHSEFTIQTIEMESTDSSGRESCDRLGSNFRCISVSNPSCDVWDYEGCGHENESNVVTNRWRNYNGDFEDYDGHLTDGEMCVYGEELADTGTEGFSYKQYRLVTCRDESNIKKIHWAHPKSKYDGFGRFGSNNIKNSYTQKK
tara:strand:+ start:131 stop:595 length:465 start_codon:yes stop_codon:yes gene_type:complete